MPPDVHISSPGRMASKTGLLLNVVFRPGHSVVHGLGIACTQRRVARRRKLVTNMQLEQTVVYILFTSPVLLVEEATMLTAWRPLDETRQSETIDVAKRTTNNSVIKPLTNS